jgi:leucyl aminopeptidase
MLKMTVTPINKLPKYSVKTYVLFSYENKPAFINRYPNLDLEKIRLKAQQEGFESKLNQAAVIHPENAVGIDRLILIGLGLHEDSNAEVFRRAGGRLAKKLLELKLKHAIIDWTGDALSEIKRDDIFALMSGILLGSYQYTVFKTVEKNIALDEIIFRGKDSNISSLKREADHALSYARAVFLTRDLVNGPPSLITPKHLVNIAKQIASSNKVHLKIFEKKDLIKMKAGGILGVNRGSAQDPFLIHLHYKPAKFRKSIALVGKGITFDSGGLSLKPANAMETMKMDMAGAATVLSVFSELVHHAPAVEVHGIIPTTENMPGDNAYKPGDVLTALNGKTMEVLNTDAEGRLILADALSYAVLQKIDGIIDLATLTGACVIALGSLVAGAMSNNPELLDKLKQATIKEGESIWELPLVKEYRNDIKSKVADIKNIGGSREAGTIIGALFLQEFVGSTPWIHLDIAGPAYLEKTVSSVPYLPHGGTGFMVRSLLRFLTE